MHWPGKNPERSFKVKSKSDPNTTYTVDVWEENDLICSCLYNYYKRKDCSHISKVRLYLAREKAQRENKL